MKMQDVIGVKTPSCLPALGNYSSVNIDLLTFTPEYPNRQTCKIMHMRLHMRPQSGLGLGLRGGTG